MIPREVQALFDVLEPLFGDQIKALRVEYQMNPGSRPEIELLLTALVERSVAGQSSVVPPPKHSVAGAYRLGDVLLGDQMWDSFGLSEDEWIQHVGIFGRSGSGKTNVGFLILRELSARRKPFLVFDWKRNYRDLLGHPEFPDLKVFTIGRGVAPFHFNPLIRRQGPSLRSSSRSSSRSSCMCTGSATGSRFFFKGPSTRCIESSASTPVIAVDTPRSLTSGTGFAPTKSRAENPSGWIRRGE